VQFVALSKYFHWWAGWSFGPRYMTDMLPVFAMGLVFVDHPFRRRPAAVPFAVLVAWSVAVQAVGAVCHPSGWNASPRNVDQCPERLWDWQDTQLRRCLERGPGLTLRQEKSLEYGRLAARQLRAGALAEAERSARRACLLDSHNHHARATLGSILLRRRDYRGALTELELVVRADPTDADALNNLGNAWYGLQRYEVALACYTRAVELRPRFATLYRNLAATHGMMGHRQAAIEMCKRTLKLDPENGTALRMLGELFGF